jgi:hypothetical protein
MEFSEAGEKNGIIPVTGINRNDITIKIDVVGW